MTFPKVVRTNSSQKAAKNNRNNNSFLSILYDTGTVKNSFPDKNTVSRLLCRASKTLQGYGIDSPRLDAEVLLSHTLNCKRIDLYVHPEKPVEDSLVENYKKAIQKRTQRVPLQYITNYAEFMSLDFYVDERVLIPRPETELLVETIINKSKSIPRESEILIIDMGTGSGNIAVTLAKKIINARIFAVDISPDALNVAQINARKHQVLDKIVFLCGDLFKPLEGLGIESKIHFIISNPPYIASDEFSVLQVEVRNFEPYVALISGLDGLQMFKRIIANAGTWLKPDGFIAFEVGEKQARKVARLLENSGGFKKPEYTRDYQHIHRIVIAQKEGNCGQNRY